MFLLSIAILQQQSQGSLKAGQSSGQEGKLKTFQGGGRAQQLQLEHPGAGIYPIVVGAVRSLEWCHSPTLPSPAHLAR